MIKGIGFALMAPALGWALSFIGAPIWVALLAILGYTLVGTEKIYERGFK